MLWDVKYHTGENSIKEIIEKSKKINKRIEGEEIIIGDIIYWRKRFPDHKIKYLNDYPNVNQLFIYRKDKKRTNEILDEVSSKKNRTKTYPYSKTLKVKMSNITLHEELYDAQFDLREERRIHQNQRIIEEKDIIIQDTVNQYEKIGENTVRHIISDINNSVNESNRFNKCESSNSSYSSYDEYKDLMQDINEMTQNSEREDKEYLEVIKILRNIQKDQASQIEEIKGKMPINRKNVNYEHISE
ncbi:28746_t:CDS:2 [Racocetra persica]|uniref:28746_t:CDS:1 n=1 Tax=Racocetra persica TaxID=160502 RepID=A0ACA9M9K8_9GLOM|nr:28746_t:CDS:2 [Racocetra persica]